MIKKDFDGMFDWALYGMLVRKQRTDMGYKKAVAFAKTIWRRTRTVISRDSIYKIEQGRQIPSAEQFMAINLALFGSPFEEDIVQLCMSKEWKQIVSKEVDLVPFAWKLENAQAVRDECSNIGCREGDIPPLAIDESVKSEGFAFWSCDDEGLFADSNDWKPGVK